MSVVDPTSADADEFAEVPEFRLEFLYDDESAPTEVTVFRPETLQEGATEWLTIDYEHAVSVKEAQ